jgi:hypothetical protein
MKFSILNRLILSVTLLTVGAFCQNAHAQWSSLNGNNHSASVPRPQQPSVNHAPAPQVHEPQPMIRTDLQPTFHPQPQPVHEQPHIVEPVRPPPAAVDRARELPPAYHTQAAETDRRRMDIDEDRRQSYYWSDYHRGMRVDRLPDGYHRFHFHDHDYFYFQGVFYDGGPSGYVVIDPPIDADIPDVPPGSETVEMNGTVYYYADGAFYVQQADGSYVVAAAPIGVTVSLLSPDATAVVINGATYYLADGTYYLPVMQNGVTAYLTVAQPG